MPSGLRYQVPLSTVPASPTIRTLTASSPQKKQKMSLTQTYYLAHSARGKLSKEAARADHDLRLLVGHANLLDGLMIDLANAEQEQESWFNQTVKNASKTFGEPKHIQWADTIPEELEEAVEEEFYAESSDSDSDSDDDEGMQAAEPIVLHKTPQAPVTVTTAEYDDDEDMLDEESDDELALTRTSSAHPPELLHDEDSESEDDSMPPSPEMDFDSFSEKQRQAIATTSYYQPLPIKSSSPASLPESDQSFFDEGFYLPQRQQTAIAAC